MPLVEEHLCADRTAAHGQQHMAAQAFGIASECAPRHYYR
jgi:hypothetical protein